MAHVPEQAYWASLRPSRIREVQAGRFGWSSVDLLDIEEGGASALRPGLEALGLHVNYLRIGTPRHFVNALSGEAHAPFVVLACHGDEGRIVLPELADEIESFQPLHRYCGGEELKSFARLPGSVVIATGCDTGNHALSAAFCAVGASAYIAPEGAPFAYASFVAPLLLFYNLTENRTLEEAVARVRAHDGELAMWRLYRPD